MQEPWANSNSWKLELLHARLFGLSKNSFSIVPATALSHNNTELGNVLPIALDEFGSPFPGGDAKENKKDDEEAEVDGELGQQES